MTDSLPSPDDRTTSRRDADDRGGLDDPAHPETHQADAAIGEPHEEQPGFPDEPASPAEGGD